MIKFIVVEDNEYYLDMTEKIIMNYMMKNNYDFDVVKLNEWKEDREYSTDDKCIYLLDYQLDKMTAIDVARKIRLDDWLSPIIVFTVNETKALETFKQRLQILDFVSKYDNLDKNLEELFDICIKQFNHKSVFKYKTYNYEYIIDVNKILYIYRDTSMRKCIIVTDNNEHEVSLSLKSFLCNLPDTFKYCHKGCIINTDRIEKIDWKSRQIVFDNGMSTNIVSKSFRKELMNL